MSGSWSTQYTRRLPENWVIHPEEEKAHFYLQIPNRRVCGRQPISSPSYGVKGQEAKELNSDLIQEKKVFWHEWASSSRSMTAWEVVEFPSLDVRMEKKKKSWTGPSHIQPALSSLALSRSWPLKIPLSLHGSMSLCSLSTKNKNIRIFILVIPATCNSCAILVFKQYTKIWQHFTYFYRCCQIRLITRFTCKYHMNIQL